MDNSRKKNRRFDGSIDGFVGGSGRSQPKRPNLRAFDQYYKAYKTGSVPGNKRRLDSFNSIDGFTPAATPEIRQPGAPRQQLEVTDAFESSPSRHTEIQKKVEQLKQDQKHKRNRRRLFKRKHDKAAKVHKHPKRRMALRIGAAFGALLILVGAGLALRAFLTGRNIFKGGGNSVVLNNQNVDPSLLRGEGDGRVNILVLGKGGEEQRSGPDLTDTIILASIDPIAKEAVLLGVPRDFWVKTPSGAQSKVNQVYADRKQAALNDFPYNQRGSNEATAQAEKAGLDALKSTLSDTLGVPIHYHAMIDFAGFKKAIDTVGGIEIDVKEALIDPTMAWQNGGRATIAGVGRQQFNGHRALMYARSRLGTRGTDFGRSERQREVILALKEKVLSTGTLANPIRLNQLISDFGNQMSTDFSINEIMRVYELAKEIPGDKVQSVGLEEYVQGDMINGLSVQVPKAGIFDYSEIHNYVRNVMRDAFLKSEDAKIMILNGTDVTGLATRKSTELKSYGYNVISVGDAPTKNYTQTVLVDMRRGEKKYTLNYLEKRLNVKSTGSLPDSGITAGEADFVIILGTDANN